VEPSDTVTAGKNEGSAVNGTEIILSVKNLTVGFGSNIVLDKLNLDIYRGEILRRFRYREIGTDAHGPAFAAAPFRLDQDTRCRI
jgi:hypothetical protein